MRIRNNGPASRSYRSYKTNSGALSKNLEKLSSGYQINRSADDAAGLAISEKMRAQITGLTEAQRNASHGIGLIQTAEGALQEQHEILNRMLQLSTQSANGTYDDAVDRQQLQKEMAKLAQELNRIADTANFNGVYPLNGGYSTNQYAQTLGVIGEEDAIIDKRLDNVGAQSGEIQFSLAWDGRTDLDLHCETDNGHIYYGNKNTGGGVLDVDAQYDVMMDEPVENIYFEEASEGRYYVYAHNFSYTSTVDEAIFRMKVDDEVETFRVGPLNPRETVELASFVYSVEPPHIRPNEDSENAGLLSGDDGKALEDTNSVRLLIGENGEEENLLDVPIVDMHANAIGLKGVNIGTQLGAINALSKIRTAINNVSDVRGTYGALQNRLEHTINNLGTMRENIQDAESTIRDTDMAAEMMKYTKNNILVQSAQSMLAQANMLPQGVLGLLQ